MIFEFLSGAFRELIPGATLVGLAVFLFRNWIIERLKANLKNIYDKDLEDHKAEISKDIATISHKNAEELQKIKLNLDRELEKVKHQHGIDQLRTSLYFENQRNALSEILVKIIHINETWWNEGYYEEVGLTHGAPEERNDLKDLYAKHRLFLDEECCMAIEIAMQTYQESLPFGHDGGPNLSYPNPRDSYEYIQYATPRIAALFQKKLGLASDTRSIRQLALLDAIRILNQYHFKALDLPTKSSLSHNTADGPAEAVRKGEQHYEFLLEKCIQLQSLLQNDATFFHEAEGRLTRLIAILKIK